MVVKAVCKLVYKQVLVTFGSRSNASKALKGFCWFLSKTIASVLIQKRYPTDLTDLTDFYNPTCPLGNVSRDFILVQNVYPLPRILSGFSLCYVRESSGSRFSFFFSAGFNPVLITSPTRSKSSVPKKMH